MRETAAVEDYLMPERRFHRVNVGGPGNTDLAGFDISVEREIEQTLFLAFRHAFHNGTDSLLVFMVAREVTHPGPKPFPVLPDVEVKAPVRAIGIPACLVEVHLHAHGIRIGRKKDGKARSAAALHVLSPGKALEPAGVNPVVRIRGIVECLAHEIEFRSLNFEIPRRILRIKRKCHQHNDDYWQQFLHF